MKPSSDMKKGSPCLRNVTSIMGSMGFCLVPQKLKENRLWESELILLRGRGGMIDTSTASGRFFFHVMASLAEMESARKLLAGGVLLKDVAKNLGVSVPTLYRWFPASS